MPKSGTKKKKSKMVTVPFKSDIPASKIIGMLERSGELAGVTIEMTKGFWDRTFKYWKQKRFIK